jgi:hypothetical protein
MSLKIKSTKVRGICEKMDDMENKTNDKSTTVEIKKRKKDNSYKNQRLHGRKPICNSVIINGVIQASVL